MSAAGVIPVKEPGWLAGLPAKLPGRVSAEPESSGAFLFGFFTANVHNENTRRAYYKALCRFSSCCEWKGLNPGENESAALGRVYPMDRPAGRKRAGPVQTFGETTPGGPAHAL